MQRGISDNIVSISKHTYNIVKATKSSPQNQVISGFPQSFKVHSRQKGDANNTALQNCRLRLDLYLIRLLESNFTRRNSVNPITLQEIEKWLNQRKLHH